MRSLLGFIFRENFGQKATYTEEKLHLTAEAPTFLAGQHPCFMSLTFPETWMGLCRIL